MLSQNDCTDFKEKQETRKTAERKNRFNFRAICTRNRC